MENTNHEMSLLIDKLEEFNIPFEIDSDLFGCPQLWYPSKDEDMLVCDVICNPYSYGFSEGLLEIMGLVDEEEIGDAVEGYLTHQEIFSRIYNHYKEKN